MRISDWSSDVCSSDLARIQPQPRRLAHDVGLGHVEQRGLNGKAVSLQPRLGRQVRHLLERGGKGGTAIRISGIIERVDADIEIARARRLRPAERDRKKDGVARGHIRSEEHTSELQSLMRISYAVFCLKKQHNTTTKHK